jgi:hypothetical protein
MKENCPGYILEKPYNPEFCFGISNPKGSRYPNLVGCYQMDMHISQYSGMYKYGRWLNLKGDFMYDKKIMHTLLKQTKKKYGGCPYLNIEIAKLFIELWPMIVNPNEDSSFEIYPPVIDKFNDELMKIGLQMQSPSPTSYGEEYPVITNTSIFVEIIDKMYKNENKEQIKIGLMASYTEICEQIIHYFD